LGSPCDCDIEPPGFLSHGVSSLVKSKGKKPLRRPRRRWEENIRMDLKEVVREIGLIRLRMGIIGEPL
jgi:hypothetical protein